MRGAVRHAEEHAIYVEAWIKRAYAVLLLDEALPICANRVTVQVVFFGRGGGVQHREANTFRPAGAGVFRKPIRNHSVSVPKRPGITVTSRVVGLVFDAVNLRGIANCNRHIEARTTGVIPEWDLDF